MRTKRIRAALDGVPSTDRRSDEELVVRFVADRDEAAFAALVFRHAPGVRAACRSWLTEPADVDDAAQAAFLVLVRRADSIRRPSEVGPWLYRTAEHCARRLKAQLRRHVPLESDPPARCQPDGDLQDAIHSEIGKLPAHFRRAVSLCHVAGLTASEAAERLGIPRNTVLAHLSRGRAILRRRLGDRGLAPVAALATAPAGWVTATAGLARDLLIGRPLADVGRSVSLSQGVGQAMFWSQLKLATLTVLALVAFSGSRGFRGRRPIPFPRRARRPSRVGPRRPHPSRTRRRSRTTRSRPFPPAVGRP